MGIALLIAVLAIMAALVALWAWTHARWINLKTEGGSRVEQIDRLQAYLKDHGIKTRLQNGVAGTVHIKVKEQELTRAKALLEAFENEN